MYWNLIWKSPGFVPFGANLTHFGSKSGHLVQVTSPWHNPLSPLSVGPELRPLAMKSCAFCWMEKGNNSYFHVALMWMFVWSDFIPYKWGFISASFSFWFPKHRCHTGSALGEIPPKLGKIWEFVRNVARLSNVCQCNMYLFSDPLKIPTKLVQNKRDL